jgi:hypothetical protein
MELVRLEALDDGHTSILRVVMLLYTGK